MNPLATARRRRSRRRGATLIEVIVAIGLAVLLSGTAFMGLGTLRNARLREAATIVSSAMRIAYTHANRSSKPTRVVFNFQTGSISIEQSEGRMLLQRGDKSGGAEASTEAEREAAADAESILKGPRAPRAQFKRVDLNEFGDDTPGLRKMPSGIVLRQVEVEYEENVIDSERAYLYFWPGGQTQRAAVQVAKENNEEASAIFTVSIAPLTGKVSIELGDQELPRPRTEEEASEREDS